jgi:plasmid rolling circle replication initiator protein Rep
MYDSPITNKSKTKRKVKYKLINAQEQDSTDLTVLQDKKPNGRDIGWRRMKKRGLLVAESLKRLGKTKKSMRMADCGTYLKFELKGDDGRKHLVDANFCKIRLCPMCSWRRSLRVFMEVSQVIDTIQAKYPDLKPVFLTLTLRNSTAGELPGLLDEMFKAWHRVASNDRIKRIYPGWFRALEVTHNKKEDTYHPHFHVIMLVDKSYFTGSDYMDIGDWIRLWKKTTGVDYDPSCFVRAITQENGTRHRAVAEVAKYTVKTGDYIGRDKKRMDGIVSVLSGALENRRLFAFGGLMKKIAKENERARLEEAEEMREDVAGLFEEYRWDFGLGNYLRTSRTLKEKQ